jgi:hypothetical protein
VDTASWGSAGRAGLARYVIAAALARTADGGAVVAIVLLVTTQGGGGSLAGLLGACITAPHLLGPFIARRIDLADDGRKVIAFACVLYSFALAAAVLTPAILTGLLLSISGCCGPLLTGGISSRLPAIAGSDQHSQRRAQGWDVATYGIGGTVGPSVVAAVSSWASPGLAAFSLAVAAFCAAWLIIRLPYSAPEHGGDVQSVPGAWSTIALMVKDGPLRRTLYMTMLVAFSMAALPITAVHMTALLGVPVANAAAMTAAYGIGNLTGSVGVMLRPLRGSPDLRQGVLCEALNPKSAMFFLAFLPQFVQTKAGSVSLQLGVLGMLFVVIGAAVTIVYACAAGRVGAFLKRSSTIARWQNKVVGSLFCALGVHLALQER